MSLQTRLSRRRFLQATGVALGASTIRAADSKKLKVGVIGHTGRGGYGHGLDIVWTHLEKTQIVAVADPNADGLEKAKKKLNVETGFSDYRQMMKQVQPDIVAICPRHVDQHHDMLMAAIDAGVKGIYIEKPFCRTPAEVDDVLAASKKSQTKIAIAHRNRYHPTLRTIDKLIADGKIGRLLEIRGRGKGDRRGGAEDLWVLGSHVLNLVAYFGGPPKSCTAVMLQDGKPVTKQHVRPGNEGLGLLAGNELHARYELGQGVIGYFDSIANDGTRNAGFGLQLIGSQGIIALQCDRNPLAFLVPGNPFAPTKEARPWIPISTAGVGKPEPRDDLDFMVAHHGLPAHDLVEAIQQNREPLCNAAEGLEIVEMICGVFESHRQSGRAVRIPLKERGNALGRLN